MALSNEAIDWAICQGYSNLAGSPWPRWGPEYLSLLGCAGPLVGQVARAVVFVLDQGRVVGLAGRSSLGSGILHEWSEDTACQGLNNLESGMLACIHQGTGLRIWCNIGD